MILNSELTKQAQQVMFSRKTKKFLDPILSNDIPLNIFIIQKYFNIRYIGKIIEAGT